MVGIEFPGDLSGCDQRSPLGGSEWAIPDSDVAGLCVVRSPLDRMLVEFKVCLLTAGSNSKDPLTRLVLVSPALLILIAPWSLLIVLATGEVVLGNVTGIVGFLLVTEAGGRDADELAAEMDCGLRRSTT